MKKQFLVCSLLALAIGMMSCGKTEVDRLIGHWGLEHLEYYNIDYYGHPITSTIESYDFIPGDMENGIDMVFYNNKRGEWRDRDMDTFYIKISSNPVTYDTIINPDTTVVRKFTYSYDEDLQALYLRDSDAETFMLKIETLNDNTFIYTNEFRVNKVERAVLKRLDDSKVKSSKKPSTYVPFREGALFRHESFHEQH